MKHDGYLGLGSNKGHRLENLIRALQALNRLEQLRIRMVSPLYETEPLHIKRQNYFYNLAVKIETSLNAETLLKNCKQIEQQLDRDFQQVRYGPRIIDIDILYLDRLVIDLPELQVPHPQIVQRRFVLVPLAQIAPDFIDPQSGKTVAEMLAQCRESSEVRYQGELHWETHHQEISAITLSQDE